MLRVISEEITAYRRQIDERKNDLPLWERKVLTCDEAAAYSGIGIRRLRKMALAKGRPFAIANGTQILIAREKCADGVAIHIRDNTLFSKQWQMKLDLVKRKMFEMFLDESNTI